MPFINRLSTLFSADVHAILDRIEDPLSLLKQSVRTMEDEIEQLESVIQRLRDERERHRRRCADLETRLAKLDTELDMCFESEEEALAKGLVRRKLELGKHLKQLTEKCTDIERTLDKRAAVLVENRRHLDGMREKLELLSDEQPCCDETSEATSAAAVNEQDVEVAYLQEKQRRAKQ